MTIDTPRTDALMNSGPSRTELCQHARELERESATLRAALAAVVTGARKGGREKQAALGEARRVLAKVQS